MRWINYDHPGGTAPRMRWDERGGVEQLFAKHKPPGAESTCQQTLLDERPESGRVSDAGPSASNRPGTGGRRRKAPDEGTRGKAASSWPSMRICCGSGFGGGWSSQDRWIPTGAEDCG